MKYTLYYLANPEIFAVNRIPAHSDHSFYASLAEADRDESSLIQNLNGIWKFSYAKNPHERKEGFYAEDYDTEDFDEIQVPGHMELQGYGTPQYVNAMYPWEGQEDLRPPFIPQRHNPVGSYVRYFDLDDGLKDKRIFVSFQGAENAIYVWLNGVFLGYSEDSFTPSEFELTPFIKEKNNKLCVEVYKRSTASWLEDQDFWRFSGIFRNVFLYAVPSAHVRDMNVTSDFDGKNGLLKAQLDIEGEYSAKALLTDCDNNLIAEAEITDSLNLTLENVKPWSAEIPSLYTLTVILTDENGTEIEVSKTRIGFRRFELKNGLMCLNGKRIIFKGINRHEWNPKSGRVITKEDMLYDIRFMKQNNINAVRTSHYPNNSLWYQLCDEYGIYLIDETNLETHGANTLVPASEPQWLGAVLDRAKSMYERDKNHASVLIWSCGNESDCGDDIAAMAEYFHKADSTRLVHYEGVLWHKEYHHITDMESRMYAKPADIEEYLKKTTGKPYISCEYMHAMGNSVGGLSLYTDLEDKYEAYQGGFIWDYIDQSLYKDGKLVYGGDFEDRATDYGFCTNGIVYADRKYSPKVQEVKALYSNIRMSISDGQLTVENRNLFADTDNLTFIARLEKNGEVIEEESFCLHIPAGETQTAILPFEKPLDAGEYVYHVSAVLTEKCLWAEAGHEVSFAQEIFEIEENTQPCCKTLRPHIAYGYTIIGVHGENFSMLFDKKEGGICSLKYNDYEYITRTPKVSFWRATTDNDRGAGEETNLAQWYIAGKFAKLLHSYHKENEDSMDITFVYKSASVPAFEYTVTYTAYFDGRLGVNVSYPGVTGMPDMPVFALDFKLKKQLDKFSFYGLGPDENYIDRNHGARLGLYHSTASENFSAYLNPQECGNRTGVRNVSVYNANGKGLTFTRTDAPFEMSVLPYSAYELENALHIEELPNVCYTWVRIAAKQMGVGGDDSWGAPVHEEYRIKAEMPMKLEFVISPLDE